MYVCKWLPVVMIPGIWSLHLSDPTHTNLLSFVAILLQDRDDCSPSNCKNCLRRSCMCPWLRSNPRCQLTYLTRYISIYIQSQWTASGIQNCGCNLKCWSIRFHGDDLLLYAGHEVDLLWLFISADKYPNNISRGRCDSPLIPSALLNY